jgi:hypothetical protein
LSRQPSPSVSGPRSMRAPHHAKLLSNCNSMLLMHRSRRRCCATARTGTVVTTVQHEQVQAMRGGMRRAAPVQSQPRNHDVTHAVRRGNSRAITLDCNTFFMVRPAPLLGSGGGPQAAAVWEDRKAESEPFYAERKTLELSRAFYTLRARKGGLVGTTQ